MTGRESYEVGKGKPPKHSQFQRGDVGNPKGKTSAQKLMELKNAENATIIRGRLLAAIMAATDPKKGKAKSLEFIEAGVLKLLKDAEDRGLGTAVQSLNFESPDGSMTPKPTLIQFTAPGLGNESDD
jgi:hypothetical protein